MVVRETTIDQLIETYADLGETLEAEGGTITFPVGKYGLMPERDWSVENIKATRVALRKHGDDVHLIGEAPEILWAEGIVGLSKALDTFVAAGMAHDMSGSYNLWVAEGGVLSRCHEEAEGTVESDEGEPLASEAETPLDTPGEEGILEAMRSLGFDADASAAAGEFELYLIIRPPVKISRPDYPRVKTPGKLARFFQRWFANVGLQGFDLLCVKGVTFDEFVAAAGEEGVTLESTGKEIRFTAFAMIPDEGRSWDLGTPIGPTLAVREFKGDVYVECGESALGTRDFTERLSERLSTVVATAYASSSSYSLSIHESGTPVRSWFLLSGDVRNDEGAPLPTERGRPPCKGFSAEMAALQHFGFEPSEAFWRTRCPLMVYDRREAMAKIRGRKRVDYWGPVKEWFDEHWDRWVDR
jgi:hypothetical protein